MTSPPDYSRSPGKQELPTFKTQMTYPPEKQDLPTFKTQMTSSPNYSRSSGKQELPTFKTQMISPRITVGHQGSRNCLPLKHR